MIEKTMMAIEQETRVRLSSHRKKLISHVILSFFLFPGDGL